MQSECRSGSDFNKHETPFTNTNFLNQTICTFAVLLGNTCLHSFVNKKGVRALRAKFGPLWSQKLKIAFHQFHPIGLLDEWSKCKILAFYFNFSFAMVTKMANKIGLK